MTITAKVDDDLLEAVKVDLLNMIWVGVQTTPKGHFEVVHDGDPSCHILPMTNSTTGASG
jgi:hypothetical protein